MKNIKMLIILLVTVIFVGGQIYYFKGIHPIKVSEFENTTTEVNNKERQLNKLTDQLANIEEAKKEVDNKTLALEGMKAKLPPYTMAATQLLDMSRLMDSSNFRNIHITCHDSTPTTIGESPLASVPYTIKYIAPYEASKNFVENIRSAYQFVTISSMDINNAPQESEEDRALFDGELQKQLVETTLEISLLFDQALSKEELYHPALNMLKNPSGAFQNLKKTEQGEKSEAPSVNNTSSAQNQIHDEAVAKNANFILDIYDILRSGDTYRFQGPSSSSNNGEYVGLVSSEDVYINLNISNNGYSINLSDDESTKENGGSDMKITKPGMIITSEAKQIQEEMPQIHITIKNTNKDTMPIILQGTLLENIHIYDASGHELSSGETSGKITLN